MSPPGEVSARFRVGLHGSGMTPKVESEPSWLQKTHCVLRMSPMMSLLNPRPRPWSEPSRPRMSLQVLGEPLRPLCEPQRPRMSLQPQGEPPRPLCEPKRPRMSLQVLGEPPRPQYEHFTLRMSPMAQGRASQLWASIYILHSTATTCKWPVSSFKGWEKKQVALITFLHVFYIWKRIFIGFLFFLKVFKLKLMYLLLL